MIIEQIQLRHFRNYEDLTLEPHEGINIFFGQNGSGKTNLLEAIHYCALGKSHRVNQDAHAVMIGETAASCSIRVRGSLTRNEVSIRLQPGDLSVKSVWIDQKKVHRLSEMMGVFRCVIFSPEDLALIKDGPSVRRKFLDMMISQVSRPYFIALQQYRVAMEQRNAILRDARINQHAISPMIADFERAMAEHASLILRERIRYTDSLKNESRRLYQEISGQKNEIFQVSYHGFLKPEEDVDTFLQMLESSREDDLRQGVTTVGPHRDDLNLKLNQKGMKMFASQGQIRTAALSLKLSQLRVLAESTGDQPVLLLDDVMSELDLNRRMNLLREIGNTQTFITCSDESDLDECQNHRTYAVRNTDGKATLSEKQTGPVSEKISVSEEPDFS